MELRNNVDGQGVYPIRDKEVLDAGTPVRSGVEAMNGGLRCGEVRSGVGTDQWQA